MLNKYSGLEITEVEKENINSFTWNANCTPLQIEKMKSLRESGKDLCELFIALAPNCADRSAAIRYLRLAVMQCNLAIAHEKNKD